MKSLLSGAVPEPLLRWYSIKLFERDTRVVKQLSLPESVKVKFEEMTIACEEQFDDDSESIITNERYEYISQLVSQYVKKSMQGNLTTSDKIDQLLTNRWLALPIFALIMWGIYYISITSIGTFATDWINDSFFGEFIQGNVAAFLESIQTADWLIGLIVDGIIGGVGAVLGFVPQIMILFLLISILEDCDIWHAWLSLWIACLENLDYRENLLFQCSSVLDVVCQQLWQAVPLKMKRIDV